MKIKGSTFFVTGGASGLGEQTARWLVQHEANVVLIDRNAKRGNALVQELDPSKALFISADVSSEEQVKQAVEDAVQKFGNIHGVISCAGISVPEKIFSARSGVHKLDTFEMVIKVNLIGTFNVIRLVVAQMIKQDPVTADGERGVIINVASVAAFEGQQGQTSYSASKGAIVGMTMPLARDLGPYGIRVVTIAPGIIETPMSAPMPKSLRAALVQQVAFPARLGNASEFAHLVTSIIENGYLNGTVIRLDGGGLLAKL